MALLYPFASSSKGNCTYVGTKKSGVLVDAGIGIRQFAAHLTEIGVKAGAVRGIFITHEHSDHVKGLARIQRALPDVPVYGSRGTLTALLEKGVISPNSKLELIENECKPVADMQVKAFQTPHDSAQSQCYRITTSDLRDICVCTDLGHMTEEIHENLQESNLVMLESNYDRNMLHFGSYPYFLKRRIDGKRGHLSNDDCAGEIIALYSSGVENFVLGHLSEENNRPEIAYENIKIHMSALDARADRDYRLWVAPRTNDGKVIEV